MNIKADILSRRADHNRGEDDNKDVTVLKDEWFRRIETVRKEEIAEETRREAEQHLKKLFPNLEEGARREAEETLATMLRKEWTRSMEVELKTDRKSVV